MMGSPEARRSALLGERNPMARLTRRQVRALRRLRTRHGIPYRALGEEFDVAHSTALAIVARKTWAWLA